MGQHYCEKCNRMLDDKEFYVSKNLEKYPPDGKLNLCKKCLTLHVDNWDPDTYKWILEAVDVPYIKDEWDNLLQRWAGDPSKKITGVTILGRYLSKMKLKQWKDYHYTDSERLEEENRQKKITQLKAQGYDGEDIDTFLSKDNAPPRPKTLATEEMTPDVTEGGFFPYAEEEEDLKLDLTDEDKTMLRLKWGRGYRPEEWVRLEQLYNDFENSYDIQTAGHKDTLIMVCKASLKANQLFDMGDIDGAQKMTKVYNDLMKSGNFTAAQNKAESGEFVDSVGELILMAEKQGFIPRYYVDGPQDKVDQTLLDMQHYTYNLVTEEMNLGNMIESSLKMIAQDKEQESKLNVEDETSDSEEDRELFNYDQGPITDSDYEEYFDEQESQSMVDKSYVDGEV